MFLQQILSGIVDSSSSSPSSGKHPRQTQKEQNSIMNSNRMSISSYNSVSSSLSAASKVRLCLLSEEARLQRKINQKIDNELRKEKRMARKCLKLLLLGTGESGKSTFIRQMRIIHEHGFETQAERIEYIGRIHQNILITVLTIDHAMELLDIPYQTSSVRFKNQIHEMLSTSCNYEQVQRWRQLFNQDFGKPFIQTLQSYQLIVHILIQRLSPKYSKLLKEFWTDPGVKQCIQRKNEFNLLDSCSYYMDQIDEILKESYVPTVQDILHVRIPTNGINEYNFAIESLNFKIVDVGGQRTERRKWIHCFESVTTIIYIVALSEFDQIISEPTMNSSIGSWRMNQLEHRHTSMSNNEQRNHNKLDESKALFKTIITSRWFRESSVVLFLNKFDLFAEKIISGKKGRQGDMLGNFQRYFPEFQWEPSVYEQDLSVDMIDSCADFILRMFYQQDPEQFRKRVLYSHFTCATDTGNIKIVFQAVKDTILEQMLCKEMQIF